MNWADYVILGVIGLSVVVGLMRGFIREVLSLAVWALAIWIAFTFSEQGATYLEPYIDTPSLRLAVAFAIIFIVTLGIGGMITYLVGRMIDKTGLSGTDRMAGMLFGVARGVALVVALVILAGLTPMPRDAWWQQSTLIPHAQRAAEYVMSLLPESFGGYISFAADAQAPERDDPLPDQAPTPTSGTEALAGDPEQDEQQPDPGEE